MGFRGEALPSIASVSRFTLTTRERDNAAPEGTQIIINGGKILEVKAGGGAPGTSVEVRQIFFNLPARRKFLRSEETESSHIQHYLTLAALAYPGVAFNFSKDGRLVWQWPAVNSGPGMDARLAALRERLRAVQGDDKNLLPVDFSVELAEPAGLDELNERSGESAIRNPQSAFRIWGFIGAPGVSRSTREAQHLFVNRRPIENRGLNFALLEGYHTALMKGRYPVCCLFLEIDPSAVDVNIHPSKREVKFHQERQVRHLVAQAIRETLLGFHAQELPVTPLSPAPAASMHGAEANQPTIDFLAKPRPAPGFSTPALPRFPQPLSPRPETHSAPSEQPSLMMGFAQPQPPQAIAPASPTRPGEVETGGSLSHQFTGAPVPLLHVPLRLVGVIGKLYVVLESDRGLVLLDQHAAHERILFEQMLNRLEQQGTAPSQKLLLPETVELPVRDAHFLRELLPILSRLGVGLSEFGERTFLLDALPPFVKVPDSRRFVLELVDELKAAGQEVNNLRLGEHTIAKTVCRHAVKANDPLAGPELQNLVDDLRRCAMPYTCPHGRPTLIEMNFRELEKKFGRSQ
jgi:DNA mismatch repair protein MutL